MLVLRIDKDELLYYTSQGIKQYFSCFLECKNVEYTETIQLYGKVCPSILLFGVVVHVTSLL